MFRQPRLPMLLALACALFLRALVPAGWMPATSGGEFAIQPCPAATPEPLTHTAGHHHGKHDSFAEHSGDCAFAPLLTALVAIEALAPLPMPIVSASLPFGTFDSPTFKTGPPALPPPATGPPALA